MKPHEIRALFPLIVDITEELIKSANLNDNSRCIGAKALRFVLPTELENEIHWSTAIGRVGGVPIRAKTMVIRDGKEEWDDCYAMSIKAPIIVKFIVDNR